MLSIHYAQGEGLARTGRFYVSFQLHWLIQHKKGLMKNLKILIQAFDLDGLGIEEVVLQQKKLIIKYNNNMVGE